MATEVKNCATAEEYAHALGPHWEHETYRCDDIPGRKMGKGCKTCGVEASIGIEAFKQTGDLEVFEKVTETYRPKKKK
jgi:hypothetical protein